MHLTITPSLFHKAIVLVALPFLFEAITVSLLLFLLNETEQDIAKEQQAKKILVQAYVLTTCINQACKWKIISLGRSVPLGSYDAKIAEALAPMPQAFIDLKVAAKDDKKWLGDIQLAEDQAKKVVRLMDVTRHAEAEGAFGIKHLKLMALLKGELTILEEQQDRLVANAREVELQTAASLGQHRGTLKLLLCSFLAVGALMAVALAAYFHRDTMRRLLILLANARQFRDEKPLHAPLTGEDEIGVLDKAFHEMAATVTESAARERETIKNVDQIKRDFVNMISHDLRTPLTSVQLLLEVLADTVSEEDASAHKLVRTASMEVERLIALANQLLDVERISSGNIGLELQPILIQKVLLQSTDSVNQLAKKLGIDILVDAPDELVVSADEQRLMQVLINLLSNALKFSPRNSTISICATPIDGGLVSVEVRDEGRGVPDGMEGAIFERFKQVERADATSKKGSGLGLYICKLIIEEHGGRIRAQRNEEKGTTITFTLPAIENQALRPEQESAQAL